MKVSWTYPPAPTLKGRGEKRLGFFKVIHIVITIGLLVALETSIAQAQSKTRKMLEKRSTPTATMWKHLNGVSEFSKSEMSIIDKRSVYSPSEEGIIDKRSDFTSAEEKALVKRSEFSREMMDLLEKRVEPDATQVSGVQSRSRAESRWLRVDRVADPAMVAFFFRYSMMSEPKKKQIERTSSKPDIVDVIQRASSFTGSQSKTVSGRSQASAAYLRLLRSRSSD